jgi:hypothetical protein
VIPVNSPPQFVDMTGKVVAGCRVLQRVEYSLGANPEWHCECLNLACDGGRFRMSGIHLRRHAKVGELACPACRKRRHQERMVVARQRRQGDKAARPLMKAPERKRGATGKVGKTGAREQHERLAKRLRVELGPVPLEQEWRCGFAAACRLVEQELDVRVLEGT